MTMEASAEKKKMRARELREKNRKKSVEFRKKPAPFCSVNKDRRTVDYFRWQRRTGDFQIPRETQ